MDMIIDQRVWNTGGGIKWGEDIKCKQSNANKSKYTLKEQDVYTIEGDNS